MNTSVNEAFVEAKFVGLSSASIPADNRVYCIGDIHGCSDLLLDLAKVIAQDAAHYAGKKTLVFLGDYIDRGMYSKQVIDILLDEAFLSDFDKVFLSGNHEQTLLTFIHEDSAVLKDWWHYGAQATFYSYGVKYLGIPSASKFEELQMQLKEAMPINHLEFYSNLKQSFVLGDYFFVHAGIMPGLPLDLQSANDCYWIRDEFLNSTFIHEKVVVHGHTIVKEPEILPNRIGIDTGAYASGVLSCLVLEKHSRRVLTNASLENLEKPSLYLVDSPSNTVEQVQQPQGNSTDQLNLLMSKLAEFETALLISEEGLVLASSLPKHLSDLDVESKNLALFELASQAFSVFNFGKLNELILQGAQGYTVMMNSGFGLTLLVIGDRKVNLGQILLDMRLFMEDMSALMLTEQAG